ncbi:hypothetical protein RHGRI_024877 [Rhododendron griersonianum]|nr:hypothetical protein RHGRI_024877 [Rhododendron griersonianum]
MDVLCQAKSGMGKTAVFVLSTLQQIEPVAGQVAALVLCHTRELAYQICHEFERFSTYLPDIKVAVFYGGVNIKVHKDLLKNECPHIVVGTPGRILGLGRDKDLGLKNVRHFILDECDKMLESLDMRKDVQEIFKMTPHDKQVMMFSATLSKDIRPVCKKFMQDPMEIYVDDEAKLTLHGLVQHYIKLSELEKNRKLNDLLDALDFNQVVIFVKSVNRAAELNKLLVECNFPSICIHSGMSQEERLTRYKSFKEGHKRILVATDLVGRGIDIERVNIVINYDMPDSADTYLHRGLAITFVASASDSDVLNQVQERFEVDIKELPEQIDTSTYSKRVGWGDRRSWLRLSILSSIQRIGYSVSIEKMKIIIRKYVSFELLGSILFLSLLSVRQFWSKDRDFMSSFNVLDYGAIGDGIIDDTLAFDMTWESTCNAETDNAEMIVPKGKTFLVHTLISGNIVAPDSPDAWEGRDQGQWLIFDSVNGLDVNGPGTIDGRGQGWWDISCKTHPQSTGCVKLAPTVLSFLQCNKVSMRNISVVNSPQTHILISGCDDFAINSLSIRSPGKSPNTDGIHISSSHGVFITSTNIASGDDCVSIGDNTSNIHISDVNCGPGHGVGRGHVRGVSFKSINFTDVKNPIIIDQYYCDVRDACKPTASALQALNIALIADTKCGCRSNHTHSQSCGIMEDRWTIFLISCIVLSGLGTSSASGLTSFNSFNVVNFGAAGDGKTDDSQVSLSLSLSLSLMLSGVCLYCMECSISIFSWFQEILLHQTQNGHGLAITSTLGLPSLTSMGSFSVERDKLMVRAQLGGQTLACKTCKLSGSKCSGPSALAFTRCDDLILNGLTHINSPRSHININNCKGVIVSNLHIIAPQTSPNTDGIDISGSSSIIIRNCTIGTGDDCIAIGGGSSNVDINGVTCGPGHGISIGALGRGGYDTVEEIHVRNCTFKGTMNGVRIKTWQGGTGYARKISFEKISFVAVDNPIIIDQFYCPSQTSAVELSDITYSGINGTSTADDAINLSCSQSAGCTGISIDHVNITSANLGKRTYANCFNAHGTCTHTVPPVKCLLP